MGEICFDDYLRSVVSKYQRSQDCYIQTDATDLFDFGLMVQTVEEKKEHQESQSVEPEKSKIETFPVLDGIRKYASEKVLLVGKPGSGKSTALQKMLVDEAQKVLDGQASLIPVLIELRSWRTSYLALIKDFFRAHKLRLEEEKIDALLFEGKLLLLVDGVNELPADNHARQDILTLRETNPDTPMIFTTRMLGVGGDLGIEKKLEMLPLSEPQMRQFIQMRLPEQGNQMLQQLGDRLRKFGDTPLLLSMLCDVFKTNGRVPANLGSAFRDFANLYDGKLKENVPVYEYSRSHWSKLLQQLAFAMMPQDRPEGLRLSISRSEVEEILTRFLDGEKFPKPRDYAHHWLEDLLKHHLIQVKLVGTNEEIEFRHQLIQEYYAAEYLWDLLKNNRLSDTKLQHSYLNYLDWTESLALMLELVESEEQAVRVVRLALEVDLRLGARLAGAVKYGFQEKTVGLLMREIEERKIPQLYAIKLFGETRSDYAIEFLIKSLKHQDDFYFICSIASEALVQIGSDRSVESLILILSDKNQDSFVRLNVIDALGKIRSKKSIEILIQSLKDNDSGVRSNSAKALGEIGSDRAIRHLIQSTRDQGFYVGAEAVRALGNIKDDEAVEALIQILNEKNIITTPDLREDAAEELGKIASRRAVESLIKALEDQSSRLRWTAVKALGLISSDEAIEILIQKLKSEHLSYILESYILALGEIRNEKAIDPLLQVLNDKKQLSEVRAKAAGALGNIGKDTAVESLIKALEDQDPEVRAKAAEALGNTGKGTVVKPLIKALNDQDSTVIGNAVTALGVMDNIATITPLIEVLKKGDIDVRLRTIRSLGVIGGDRVIQPLIQSLKDHHYAIRFESAKLLGTIGSNRAFESLIQSLNDSNVIVGFQAAKALVAIDRNRAIEPLIQSLRGKYSIEGFISALGDTGSNRVIDSLIQALKSGSIGHRRSALEAFKKLTKFNLNLSQQLPHLVQLTSPNEEALSVITAIQDRCKYYNYNIAQTPLQEENNNDKVLSKPQGNIINVTEINNNFSGANFGAANIANLGGTVNEQKIVQKTEVPKQSLAEATKEVQDLLNQLAKTNPSEATIADTIQQEINRNPTLKARLVNALKAGGIEALKTIFNNPFISIPVETVKGFLEAES
jgi:HEAT repeat protein